MDTKGTCSGLKPKEKQKYTNSEDVIIEQRH